MQSTNNHLLTFEPPKHNTRGSQMTMVCSTCRANNDSTSFIILNWFKPYCSKNEVCAKEHQSERHQFEYDEKEKMYFCTYQYCKLISMSKEKQNVCQFSYEAGIQSKK